MDPDLPKEIFARIQTIATQTAQMFRGQATVTEIASAPPLQNQTDLVQEIAGYLKEVYDPAKVYLFEGGGMGSEDFASYTYEIPCSYMLLGAGTPQENPLYGKPMHNECVVFNEDILPIGSWIHTYSAISWLKHHA
jgi:metal-dependent amidase/aminoacylase/carboxypeptidase family protein